MTAPHDAPSRGTARPHETPNRATITVPERSSRRTSRKAPMGWLPWALLGALALLLALVLLAVNAIDDDGAEGPAGDSLGQVSAEDGDSAIGSDGSDGSGGEGEGSGGEGSSDSSGESGEGGEARPQVDLQALTGRAVVGGGAVPVAPVGEVEGGQQLASTAGTAGVVLFAEGSAQVDAAGQEVVAATARSLQEAGATSVVVVGHTDVIAGDPVNDTLSQQRADAVAEALRGQLPGVEVTTGARGQDEPVATNETEQGRQLNRRAVVTVAG